MQMASVTKAQNQSSALIKLVDGSDVWKWARAEKGHGDVLKAAVAELARHVNNSNTYNFLAMNEDPP